MQFSKKKRCIINKKVCNRIIDSESGENVISKALVKALGVLIEPHPKPYKIGWIKKGINTKVIEICKVLFSIGNHYQDVATCDVVDMDACHILLRKWWKFDVNVVHHGKENDYLFSWKEKKSNA